MLIKEERTDADINNEITDGVNEMELHSSIKQEDCDITIKEEWNTADMEHNLKKYISLEHLDCINQNDKVLKSESPDLIADDSGIGFHISHEKDEKDGSNEELLLNICRVTKHSHDGKENNDFLDGSNNSHEFVQKLNACKTTVSNYRCSKCTKSFTTKSHLNRHEKIHLRINGEPLKTFQCHLCGNKFARNESLTRHVLNVHCGIEQGKLHPCPVCGKYFRSACNVRRHSVVHGKKARHFCNSCDSSFSQLGDLRRHQAYAHGTDPPSRIHECTICGKAYAKRTILLRHQASHSRQRLLSCDTCGKEFTRKDCLFTHIKNKHITANSS